MKYIVLAGVVLLSFTSCVGKKKFKAAKAEIAAWQAKQNECLAELEKSKAAAAELQRQKTGLEGQLSQAKDNVATQEKQAKSLEEQIAYLKTTNTNLLDRLSDLSVVSKSGAESIKKSLEALNEQNRYVRNLTTSIQRKDSINLALVMNLKRSLSDVNDQDVNVEVRKGVVYVSLSDKMLFKSGSYDINPAAEGILEKIAKVLNDHKDLDFLVEGHTDNVPFTTQCSVDNWDLSARRATAVVRLLQQKFGIAPQRMTAGGRGEFSPKTSNDTADGKRINRRTEIIILPKLDQFFDLAAPK
jgi:chemotaxis protein MotB